jgi:DNA-directed RNA polymerase specialized sigma24 family protein
MDLTPEAWEMLLARLDADRDEAGRKYVALRRKLVKFLGLWGCNRPEDQADEAMGRTAGKIGGGAAIGNLNGYALGVARLVYKENVREEISQRTAMRRRPAEAGMDGAEEERRRNCYRRCLNRLSADDQDLIVSYYRGRTAPDRDQLAEQMGLTLNALRVSAFRIRQRLGHCLEECLKQQA